MYAWKKNLIFHRRKYTTNKITVSKVSKNGLEIADFGNLCNQSHKDKKIKLTLS